MLKRLVIFLAGGVAVASFASAPASASWRQVPVFPNGGSGGRGYVDAAGAVRWAAGVPAVWRSMSPGGRLSRVAALTPGNAPTRDVNSSGSGVALYARNGELFAVRRTASGRAAHGARLVSGLGSPEGAGIADDGSSRVAWASDVDSAGEPSLYVARISAAGTLGPAQRLAPAPGVQGASPLAVAPTGWAAVAFTEPLRTGGVTTGTTLRVAVARPGGRFSAARTVATYVLAPKDSGGQREVAVAVSRTGTVAVAWLQGGEFVDTARTGYVKGDVLVSAARPGRPFGAPQRLSAGTAPDRPIGLAFSSRGEALVAWADQAAASGSLLPTRIAASSAPDGLRFGPARPLDRFARGVTGPAVGFDARGDAMAAWARHLSGDSGFSGADRITASLRKLGRRFSAPQTAGAAHGVFPAPFLRGGGRGIFAVTWDDRPRHARTTVMSAIFTP